MRLVVTGGSGMLGHCLMRLAASRHEVFGSYHSHPVSIAGSTLFGLEISNESELRSRFASIRPEVIVHTAALTDVDECEKNPDKARRINSDGTAIVAKVAEELGALLIHVSTDYVFDGSTGNYRETDVPQPVNQYGATKLLGEEYALKNCSRVAVIRTTMFGLKLPPRIGMIEDMVAALRGGKTMTRFVDQYFSPLYTGQLSEVILRIAEVGITGLYHVGSADRVSRLEFSKSVAQEFDCSHAEIHPGPFRQIEGLARRPQDTSLVSDHIRAGLGMELPGLAEGLTRLKQDWANLGSEGMANR